MIDTDSKAVIQLDDDDDDIVIEEVKPAATSDSGVPPVKRKRLNATPVPEDPKSPSAAAQAPNSLKEVVTLSFGHFDEKCFKQF